MQNLLKTYSQVFLSEGLKDPQNVYAKRRKQLAKNLKSPVIYKSANPEFLYLTGINQEGAILVLGNGQQETLFLPPKDAKKEFWEGIKLGLPDSNMKKLTGFKTILPAETFDTWIKKQKKSYLPAKKVLKIHIAQRVILEPERIALAKQAQQIAKDALAKITAKISEYKNERELSAELECAMLSKTSTGLSFPSIVAAGKNACTLHYTKKDCDIKSGDLILLDFGCKYNSVCCDISRTIPANGTFNPLQKLLYNIVLDTQTFHEKNVKPGRTLKQLNQEAWQFLETILKERFTDIGGKMKRFYKSKPHGISHLIGDEVHEATHNRDYLKQPLKEGMLISNEPGLYGHFTLKIDGVLYSEHIGIRIEDDLLITKTGCENLSIDIPK